MTIALLLALWLVISLALTFVVEPWQLRGRELGFGVALIVFLPPCLPLLVLLAIGDAIADHLGWS